VHRDEEIGGMTPAAIEVDRVWKTFRVFTDRNTTLKQAILKRGRAASETFWALRDVSFEVPRGSSFAIVGGNGAGKSTILKVLSRILVPDKGGVRCTGRLSALLELGAGFHPELTGRENVYLNGSILGLPRAAISKRMDEIIDFSGLSQFIDNPVKTYSSGMYARLGFAVAVNVDPEILLVDEVLAVGDEQFQRRCAERMADLRSDGRTVVFVSHGLGQVQQLCDQAVWLDHGEVAAYGATFDVIEKYLASVTTEYHIDSAGRPRSGSGEVRLSARVEPASGEALVSGQPAVIHFTWTAHQPVEDVAITISIRTLDGIALTSAVSAHRMPLDRLDGQGQAEYRIPSLPLLHGSYVLAAGVSGRHSGHVYDQSSEMDHFDVAPSELDSTESGIISLGGNWTRLPPPQDDGQRS
jgi:ABC-2 type transport system ATP-binding protein